jgi:acetyl esterase/lipase
MVVLPLSSLLLEGPAHAADAPKRTVHGPTWFGARSQTYCFEDGQPVQMTLFAPERVSRPAPVVIQVHGGRWQTGTSFTSLAQSLTATELVDAGFVVASIDYRLAPQYPWPDQIIDVECAVRYLRAESSNLGIDPDEIGAWGDSAGGQLVSLLGTAPDVAGWTQGEYRAESDHVAAVVDEFGPADLGATDWPHRSAVMIRNVFGAWPTKSNAALMAASPVTYVAPGDPPFLILQGTDDQVVPVSQSETLAARLRANRVPVDLVLVARGQHGLASDGESPSPGVISELITRFFERTLGSHPT